MKHKTILTLTILLVTLFAITAVSANENVTDEIASVDEVNVNLTNNNLNQGTFEELSREISSKDPGDTMDLSRNYEGSNSILIDKDITIDGHGFSLNANSKSNIFKISNCNVKLQNINFINGKSTEFGGAIYLSLGSNLTIINSTFTNCLAECGGAIYLEGNSSLEITESNFTNNNANILGGAISVWNGCDVSLTRTNFNNNTATHESGGALMCLFSNLIADNINVNDCTSEFGGAITLLSSNATITQSSFRKNRAKYDGGAIFSMYETLNLNDNLFFSNTANRASAVYSSLNDLIIINNQFISNTDSNIGVIYAMNATNLVNRTNTFTGNTGADIFETINNNLTFIASDYYSFQYQSEDIPEIPPYYSLIDHNLVTPVKNQGLDGNCWAFAAMGALESCILKAGGLEFDLSEANLKNLMALFSDYGHNILTNDGGNYKMASGYFASWLGPIFDKDDKYYVNDFLSTIFNSIMHVQNIIYFNRTDYMDNDAIKEAILKYGAVSTGIYFDDAYFNEQTNAYYYDGTQGGNHAVCIVGWDDNYSISNFKNNPSDKGAWIVRNSWGPTWGDNGYFYISYYDTRCAQINEIESYTFILNDTKAFDRIYQYEIQSTSFNTFPSDMIYYKNIFTVEGNESLAAVSTYFADVCEYELSIYINDETTPYITKTGKTGMGYYTINLDNPIYLKKNDNVTVQFKCHDFKNSIATMPVSYQKDSANLYLKPGVSYYGNGNTWRDLYKDGVVACIKIFTTFSNDNKINPFFTLNCEGDYSDKSFMITFTLPKDATGFIHLNTSNNHYSINVSETRSIKLYDLTENNNTLLITYSGDDKYLEKTLTYIVDIDISEWGTCEELFDKIDKSNNQLDLHKNYIFDSSMKDGIQLSKPLTIDGHGHTINGAGLARIFNIRADNVVLKDIIFTECSGENGGVIQVYGDNCQIINCSFINNVASTWAGAIYWIGENGIIKDSYFENNSATNPNKGGGAVFLYQNSLILNSTFVNNHGPGAAVYLYETNNEIRDCTFKNNDAGDGFGGAITSVGNNNLIVNSTFINNSASYGGAISITSYGNENTVLDCIFEDNIALNFPSAVLWRGTDGNLINSTFINTKGTQQINWYEGNGTIKGCKFLITTKNNVVEKNAKFIRNTIELTSTVYSVDYNSPEGALIKFNVVEGVPLTLTFTIAGKPSQITLENDTAILLNEIAGLTSGRVIVGIKYAGDDNYNKFDDSFTLSVNKAKSVLVLECTNTSVNRQTTLTARVVDSFNQFVNEGIVTFLSDQKTIGTADVRNGVATCTYSPSAYGEVTIKAIYTGGNYLSSDDSSKVLVDSAIVKASDAHSTVGVSTTLTANVSAVYGVITDGSVTFYVNGAFAGKSDVRNARASITYTPSTAGTLTIRAVYESGIYGSVENISSLTVDRAKSQITIDSITPTFDIASTLRAHVTSNNVLVNEGTVSFYEDEKIIGTAEVRNGVATLQYTPKYAHEYNISAVFTSSNYDSSSASIMVSVSQAPTSLDVSGSFNVNYLDTARFTVTVKSNNMNVSGGVVKVYINGSLKNTVFVSDGIAEFSVPADSVGLFEMRIVYCQSLNYMDSEIMKTLTVNKLSTKITIDSVAMVYNKVGVLTVTLRDANGRPLSGESITVVFDSVRSDKTDSNGQFILSYNGFTPKTYSVAVTFEGSDKYSKSTATGSVVVLKATPKLTAGKKTFKRKVKTKKYTVTLLDNKNMAFVGVKLTIKVNGKTFSAYTNGKGKATFKIKKLTKKGTYKSVVSFNGNAFYNKVTRTVKITVK